MRPSGRNQFGQHIRAPGKTHGNLVTLAKPILFISLPAQFAQDFKRIRLQNLVLPLAPMSVAPLPDTDLASIWARSSA